MVLFFHSRLQTTAAMACSIWNCTWAVWAATWTTWVVTMGCRDIVSRQERPEKVDLFSSIVSSGVLTPGCGARRTTGVARMIRMSVLFNMTIKEVVKLTSHVQPFNVGELAWTSYAKAFIANQTGKEIDRASTNLCHTLEACARKAGLEMPVAEKPSQGSTGFETYYAQRFVVRHDLEFLIAVDTRVEGGDLDDKRFILCLTFRDNQVSSIERGLLNELKELGYGDQGVVIHNEKFVVNHRLSDFEAMEPELDMKPKAYVSTAKVEMVEMGPFIEEVPKFVPSLSATREAWERFLSVLHQNDQAAPKFQKTLTNAGHVLAEAGLAEDEECQVKVIRVGARHVEFLTPERLKIEVRVSMRGKRASYVFDVRFGKEHESELALVHHLVRSCAEAEGVADYELRIDREEWTSINGMVSLKANEASRTIELRSHTRTYVDEFAGRFFGDIGAEHSLWDRRGQIVSVNASGKIRHGIPVDAEHVPERIRSDEVKLVFPDGRWMKKACRGNGMGRDYVIEVMAGESFSSVFRPLLDAWVAEPTCRGTAKILLSEEQPDLVQEVTFTNQNRY